MKKTIKKIVEAIMNSIEETGKFGYYGWFVPYGYFEKEETEQEKGKSEEDKSSK